MSQTTAPKGSYFSGFYNIQEDNNTFIAKRKWKSFLYYIIPILAGGFLALMWLPVGVIWPGILSLIILYFGLCGLFNTIRIKITPDQLIIKQGIFPVPLSGTSKQLKDLDRLTIEPKYSRTSTRVYNADKGIHNKMVHSSYDLDAYFKNRKINLLSFKTTDLESAEYLKVKIEEYVKKANNGNYPNSM
jgi:hypothetical protein